MMLMVEIIFDEIVIIEFGLGIRDFFSLNADTGKKKGILRWGFVDGMDISETYFSFDLDSGSNTTSYDRISYIDIAFESKDKENVKVLDKSQMILFLEAFHKYLFPDLPEE